MKFWLVVTVGAGVAGCASPKAPDYADFDGFDWDHEWTASVDTAVDLVGDDGFSSVDAEDACWDTDLGNAVGNSVGTGNQADGDNVYDCYGGTGREVVFRWTPPEPGRWTFDTVGSPSDTVLEVRVGCEGRTLACDDDGASGVTSRATVEVEAGDEVIVIVDSYSSYSEAYVVLNIN